MPPNLGGFFMVRSYYPSECHADYFDFERIEALKPAIEACGISTLSQSPILGFHKQMDNRIKLLEEVLSFRMQGVEFDKGDRYVDGHKAAAVVRDEFVSVTEKFIARRGRHTRCSRDWSSDVCSSDLTSWFRKPRSRCSPRKTAGPSVVPGGLAWRASAAWLAEPGRGAAVVPGADPGCR